MCVRAKDCLSTKSSEMEGNGDIKRNIQKGSILQCGVSFLYTNKYSDKNRHARCYYAQFAKNDESFWGDRFNKFKLFHNPIIEY